MNYAIALLPGILIIYWLKIGNLLNDTTKKKYICLFIFGALSTILACFLESVGEEIFLCDLSEKSMVYMYLDNFVVTAFSEELVKFLIILFMFKVINPDSMSSGCIPCVFIGLGFGMAENLLYSIDEDIWVMIIRAVYCVPGHALYGLYMGFFLWRAVSKRKYISNVFLALFIPIIQHGLYDFSIENDNFLLILWALIYNLILYYYAIKQLQKMMPKKESRIQTSFDVLRVSMS